MGDNCFLRLAFAPLFPPFSLIRLWRVFANLIKNQLLQLIVWNQKINLPKCLAHEVNFGF